MSSNQENSYNPAMANNTYSQQIDPNIYSEHLNQPNVIPLPNDFLETEEHQNDQDIQQRILSGECAPEPAVYCNVSNEIYGTYDPFQPTFTNQQPQFTQYAQIDDPWVYQQNDANVYVQEGFDPALNEPYTYDQPTSSSNLIDNPFEEEDPYEPLPPVKIQPMRLIGKPPGGNNDPRHSYGTRQNNPSYQPPERKLIIRRPRKQEIRRDSPEDNSFMNKDATDRVLSQTAQRIATPEGWNSLNIWLKKAQEANDRDKLINLLETCQAANINADLLRVNDTAKIVKEIARKHPNAAINRLSNDVLAKWKTAVIAASKQKPVQKQPAKVEKSPELPKAKEPVKEDPPTSNTPIYQTDEFLLDKLTQQMDKNIMNKKDEMPAAEAIKRPRTKAKVKISTSRRTGLEGDEDPAIAKKTEAPRKKSVQSPVLENVTAPKTTPPPKRVLQQSDMFMAAFDDVEKKPPVKKKLKVNKIVKVVQPDVPEKNSPPIKSEWDIKPEATSKQSDKLAQIPIIRREKGAGILRKTSLTPDEKALRKIRFTDQFDKPIADIRYFDIEEGERINVHRGYAHDQIKRWEMEEEGKQMKLQKSGDSETNDQEDPSNFISSASVKLESSSAISNPNFKKDAMPPLPLSGAPTDLATANANPWNLLLLESFSTIIRGSNSKLAELEAGRERSSMAAFIDPNTPTNAVGEDDSDLLSAAEMASRSTPSRIPLTLQTSDQKPDKDQLDIAGEDNRMIPGKTLQLPLPFSSPMITDTSPRSPTILNNFNLPIISNIPTISLPTTSTAETQQQQMLDEYDNLMALLNKQKTAANNDQDLRPVEEQMELDQDLRSPSDEPMDYTETPLSPPAQIEIPGSSTSKQPSLTLDALSALAALAGKDSGSVTASLNLAGGLNLADILNKVESAQSGNTVDPSQHQYTQEDHAPPVITQIPGDFQQTFFRHPDKYNPSHQYHPKTGIPITAPPTTHFQAPGIRPTVTNPRGAFFHTATNMNRFRTVPCKYFLAGNCNFGEACRFLHTTPDGEIVPYQEQQQPSFQPPPVSPSKLDESSSSFQLALAPKTSSQSIEAAVNYVQRGGRRGFRGSNYRGYGDERSSRGRDRSPRRYDDRRRYSPDRSSRRRRSRSNSADSRDGHENRRRRRRSASLSSNEGRKRSSERRERSPPKERSREMSPEKRAKSRSRSRSLSPKRSSRRSSRQEPSP